MVLLQCKNSLKLKGLFQGSCLLFKRSQFEDLTYQKWYNESSKILAQVAMPRHQGHSNLLLKGSHTKEC